jgi:hypothetical protein
MTDSFRNAMVNRALGDIKNVCLHHPNSMTDFS